MIKLRLMVDSDFVQQLLTGQVLTLRDGLELQYEEHHAPARVRAPRRALPSPTALYPCAKCDKEFTTVQGRGLHTYRIHTRAGRRGRRRITNG